MALVVAALKNHLSNCESPYIVHTSWSDTIDTEELVSIMANGRTTLTKPDITGCLTLLTEEIVKLLADGKYVRTPLGSFYLCASGKLDAPDQAFTPGALANTHDIRMHFRADKSLEAALLAKAKIERGERFDRNEPILFSVASVKTEEELKARSGDFIRVLGQRLKFDKASPEEGLFFVNGAEHRSLQYASISPTLVIAEVPTGLAAGDYSLVLRSRQGGKLMHEGRAQSAFTVEA